jgi:hypothetical protein
MILNRLIKILIYKEKKNKDFKEKLDFNMKDNKHNT